MKQKHSHLSETILLAHIKNAAKTEKKATFALLEYLCEVDMRRAFAAENFTSLFDYLVRGLGYSDSQSAERVAAVRLMRQNDQARESIQTGKLTLTSAAQIQRFIQSEKKVAEQPISPNRANELIQICESKSKREVEKILFTEASPETKTTMRERVKFVNETELEVKMTLNVTAQAKLKRVRELIHTNTMAEVFERALDSLIAEKEKSLGKSKRAESDMAPTPPAEESVHVPQKTYANVRYIPAKFKRIIYERSKGQCEFTSATNTRCPSRIHLEVDHVTPIALGGKTEITNLRQLCRNHNQYRARELFDE
jgi:hypothetical protein